MMDKHDLEVKNYTCVLLTSSVSGHLHFLESFSHKALLKQLKSTINFVIDLD